MRRYFIRALALLLCFGLLLPCLPAASASDVEDTEPKQEATDISSAKYVTECVGFPNYGYFFDGKVLYGGKSNGDAHFTVEHEEGVGSIYIIFQEIYGAYTVTDNTTGTTYTAGEGGFYHDFLDLETIFGAAPASVTVEFSNGVAQINEIYLFTPGEVPDFVQKWEMPADGETDLVLFSTHGDDEHLFFAGILPYYAVERDYQVQVVYLTDHRNNSSVRFHEMLNGLWAVGIKTYPVFGKYNDFRTSTMESAYSSFQALGWDKEEMLGYVVEQLRRFKPMVVVAHDFEGEYHHGQHMVYADLVAQALEISNDATRYPELAEEYGLWEVSKAYFHLYEENQIIMDWDQPLESFGGKTAFEVSIYRGFQCHETQIRDFAWYYAGFNSAISLPKYNPCYFGLYWTTVGPDVEKNDFFENVTCHTEQVRQEQEQLEQARLEEERREQERLEHERLEAERLAQEEAAEIAAAEAAAKAELEAREQAAREAKEARSREDRLTYIILIGGTLLIVVALLIVLRPTRKPRKKKGRFGS